CIGTLLSSFTPGESVDYYINGAFAATFTADANGRLAVSITTAAGPDGYLTMEGRGQSSSKRAGGTAYVSAAAALIRGATNAPHGFNETTGINQLNLRGNRWPASTTINLARNGTLLGTVTSSAAGTFNVVITIANNGDTSAVYSAYTADAGAFAGQSAEERADAGTPPQGDMNVSRAYFDRPILPATGGAIVAFVGEGFQPGETVSISGCASASVAADANGSVAAFISFSGGTGTAQCVYTGATSGRVARGTVQGDPNIVNTPSAICKPATLFSGATSFVFAFDRLTPSETGTVFIDGVSQGSFGTDSSGIGSAVLTAPSATGPHSVLFIGSSGDVAVAPLFVTPACGTYTFLTTPRTFVPGVTHIGNHCDDCSTVIALPFPVSLYGNTYVGAAAGSNGSLTFGTPYDNFDIICWPSTQGSYVMAPYWGDQCTNPLGCGGLESCVNCGI